MPSTASIHEMFSGKLGIKNVSTLRRESLKAVLCECTVAKRRVTQNDTLLPLFSCGLMNERNILVNF